MPKPWMGGIVVAVLVVSLSLPRAARAEVFHDTQILAPWEFSLGFEGEMLFDPNTNYLAYAHLGVGLPGMLDFGAKVSFFDQNTYFGGDVQAGLLADGEGYPGLAAWAGGHWIDVPEDRERTDFFGLDGGIVISEGINPQLGLYFGYDLDVEFIPKRDRPLFAQRIFGGVRITGSRHLSFFIEGAYALENREENVRHYISGGPTLYF